MGLGWPLAYAVARAALEFSVRLLLSLFKMYVNHYSLVQLQQIGLE